MDHYGRQNGQQPPTVTIFPCRKRHSSRLPSAKLLLEDDYTSRVDCVYLEDILGEIDSESKLAHSIDLSHHHLPPTSIGGNGGGVHTIKIETFSGAPLCFAPSGANRPVSGRQIVSISNANNGDNPMTDLLNFIRIEENGTLTGNIASVAFDLDVSGEPFQSTNSKAPAYRLFARTPRGRRLEIGGIWKKKNQSGGEYLTLSVNTGHGKLNANLGRFPGQDDEYLMSVIPWD